MICKDCDSKRIASINAKSSDQNCIIFGPETLYDYVPTDMGIGGGDYVNFYWCLDCGGIQGDFPLPETEIERRAKDFHDENDG